MDRIPSLPTATGTAVWTRICAWSIAAAWSLVALDVSAASLSVDDGVVVKFGNDAGLVVHDTLNTAHAVIFTSVTDDGTAGQTLSAPATPAAGDWLGVQILPSATPDKVDIDGLTLRYAGNSNAAALEIGGNAYQFDALWIANNVLGIRAQDGATVAITGSSLINNGVALESRDSTPTVSGSEILGNAQYGAFNATPQSSVNARSNWWGAASGPYDAQGNPGGQGDPVSLGVDYGQYLGAAPLLDCRIATADGNTSVSSPAVTLTLNCRNAVSFRLAESVAGLAQSPDAPMASTATYTIAGAARALSLYAKFTAANGSTKQVGPLEINFSPDAPTVVFVSPASNAQLSTDTLLSVDVTSATAIQNVAFLVDGHSIATIGNPPYQTVWSIAGVPFGTHALKAVATDSAGITGEASIGVTVQSSDQTGPTIQSVTFAGAPLTGLPTLTASGTLSVQASDPSGIGSVSVTIDGNAAGIQYGNQNTYALPLNFGAYANGQHRIVVTATDNVSNSTSSAFDVKLNLPSPSAPTIFAPASVTQANVVVTGTAEFGTQVQLYVDGNTAASVTVDSAGTFSGTVALGSEGDHEIKATASSNRGTSPLSNTIAVHFSVPGPTVVITSPAAGALLSNDVDASASAVDASGIARVDFFLDNGSTPVASVTTVPYTWHWAIASAADGDHTITVIATNTANKSATASVAVRVQKTPPPPTPVQTPYTGIVQSVTPASSYGQDPIVISGQALDRVTNTPVPHAPLAMTLRVNKFKRQINFTADASGNFAYSFVPHSSDAGTYDVFVLHPAEVVNDQSTAQKQFTIDRLTVSPTVYNVQAALTIPLAIPVSVTASAGNGASSISITPTSALPSGVTIGSDTVPNVGSGATTIVNLHFLADSSADMSQSHQVILTAYSNGSARGTVTLNYTLSLPQPGLYPDTSYVSMGATPPTSQTLGTPGQGVARISNRGLIAATGVTARLGAGADPVPSWATISSGAFVSALEPGAIDAIQINAVPPAGTTEKVYNLLLYVGASNARENSIPVTISVYPGGTPGHVDFHVSDIYTNFNDGTHPPIKGVANATITLQSETLAALTFSTQTDSEGKAALDAVPPDHYIYRASASNHADTNGRITVQPGVSSAEEIFLDYNLITVSWSVTETDIADHYNVTLNATYETQVPAPVVLMQPMAINLPEMQKDEVVSGELTISNYGLVRADNVRFIPPANDTNYQYDFLGDVPTSLAAHQRVTVAYKVTALVDTVATSKQMPSDIRKLQDSLLHPTDSGGMDELLAVLSGSSLAKADGGSCHGYAAVAQVPYEYTCANGTTTGGSAQTSFARMSGSGCASSGTPGVDYNPGGPTSWPGGWGGASGGTPLSGSVPGCIPVCDHCGSGGAGGGGGGPAIGSGG
jgi:hypothetical protein